MLTTRQTITGLGAGALALVVLALFLGSAFGALVAIGGEGGIRAILTDAVILSQLRFTLIQAALSTLLSLTLALPLSRALARRQRFFGRTTLIRLLALPMGLPVLVGALGLVGIWGRNGLINDALAAVGGSRFGIYGLPGILIAHAFFNMPLAARLMLSALERIAPEYWLIGENLGMRSTSLFRFIEWPVLKAVLPGIAALVFMLCVTSFTLVLIFGGGPAATTLEVAIYQALRFDFNPPRAVTLALLQIAVAGAVLALLSALPAPEEPGTDSGRPMRRLDGRGALSRLGDGATIALSALFLLLPLGAVLVAGLRADLVRLAVDPAVQRAALTSLLVSGASAMLSITVAWAALTGQYAAADRARRADGLSAAGITPLSTALRGFAALLGTSASLVLLVPSMVVATGWFMILHGFGAVGAFAPLVVAGINMLMALPFVMRVLGPAFKAHRLRSARLSASLGISGFAALRRIDWPVLRRPLLTALSFAMALSLGDLGAVALFGAENLTTLPWLIYSRLGHYRSHDADGLALVLGLVCLGLTMFGARGTVSNTQRNAP